MRGPGKKPGRIAVGHPIDVASGAFFAEEVDHAIDGVIRISIERKYDTRFLSTQTLTKLDKSSPRLPFGRGWRPCWQFELRTTLSGFLYVNGEGLELQIDDHAAELTHTGRLLSPEHGIELNRAPDGSIRITGYGRGRDNETLHFVNFELGRYRLAAIERNRASRIELLYDSSTGAVSHLVQRRERRTYALDYDHRGLLSRVGLQLADGSVRQVLAYHYDDLNQLSDVVDERGLAKRYVYDDDGRLIRDEKRGGAVYSVRYDSRGRCVYASGNDRYEERTLRFNDIARNTHVHDSHGALTVYDWNDAGQVTKIVSPSGEIALFTFDTLGRPHSETNTNGVITDTLYDSAGHVVEQRVAGAPNMSYVYDDNHHLVEACEHALDSGEVLAYERIEYDVDHNIVSVRSNGDPGWNYRYSEWGELIRTEAPSGAVAERWYNDTGGLVRATNFENRTWTWTRDLFGRLLTETDPLGHTWRLEYLDVEGRSTRLTEPDGRVYTELVSDDDRLIRQLLPGGRARQAELSFCGLLLASTDEDGAVTRLRWGTEPGELSSIENANGDEYRFGYDADLRLVSRRTFDGRLLRTTWKGARKAATRDAAGSPTEFDYDALGRLICERNADGETKFDYDARGYLRSIVSPTSSLVLERDSRGRVTAEVCDGQRVTRALDVMGLPVSYTSSRGVHSTYEWSATGLLQKIGYDGTEISFERDALGREVRRRLGQVGTFEHTYDPVGRVTSQRYSRSHLRAPQADSLASSREFSFDDRGMLAGTRDSLRGPSAVLHSNRGDLTGVVRPNAPSEFFSFDSCRNRVLSIETNFGPTLASAIQRATSSNPLASTIALDALAASIPHSPTRHRHGPGDRLVEVDAAGRHIELVYDANGRVIEKIISNGANRQTWKYSWNAKGELCGLLTPTGAAWSYRYDPAGRRIEKKGPVPSITADELHSASAWKYTWIRDELIETVKDGILVEAHVAGPESVGTVLRDDGEIHFVLPDRIGGSCDEVDARGEIEWSSHQRTWGEGAEPRGPTGGMPFVGQWLDVESGLHYNRFRYYDPDCGRFLSPDPIDLLGGPNAYSGISDPLSDYDPDGLVPTNAPDYGLYHIVDMATGETVYVGITHTPDGSFDRRREEHKRSGRLDKFEKQFKLVDQMSGLTYAEARGFEQADIAHYNTLKAERRGDKKIRLGDGNRVRSYDPNRKTPTEYSKERLAAFKEAEERRKKKYKCAT